MGPTPDLVRRTKWSAARPGSPPFETACVAPWVSLEFDPEGWVHACCASQLYPLGRVGESSLSEFWNGPRAEVLKSALMEWDFSVACQPCRFGIDHGNGEPVAGVYDRFPLESGSPDSPHSMSFALSNRCNLGCIMCTPALSSRLRHEAGLCALDSPYDDRFFFELQPFLEGLRIAKFLGGEPFLVPEHRRVWEMLESVPKAPKLEITTNGTVWTPSVEWLMERFRVDISVSVDALTRRTYETVRRGGDFSVLRRNLDRFAERCRSRGTNLHLSFCLMPQNWWELAPFLVWAEQYTFGPPVTVSNVATRGMSLLDLPTERLEEVRDQWSMDDTRYADRMRANRAVWEDQRSILDRVLDERLAGSHTGAPRSQPVAPDAFSSTDASVGSRVVPYESLEVEVAKQNRRLRLWSQDSVVGELRLDESDIVTAVVTPHAPLGIFPASLEGRSIDDLAMVMAASDGRLIWAIDSDVRPDHVVRAFVLAASDPIRGTPGASVRTVQVFHPLGSVVLVAVDGIFDRASDGEDAQHRPVAVETPVRRTPPRIQ